MLFLLGLSFAAGGALIIWGGISGSMAAILAAIFDKALLGVSSGGGGISVLPGAGAPLMNPSSGGQPSKNPPPVKGLPGTNIPPIIG